MEEISDRELLEIAEKVSATKLLKLGVNLRFEHVDIDKYLKMNEIHGGCRGSWALLQAWKENTRVEDQRAQLKRALEDAQLGGIADQHFGHLNHINGEGVSEESTESMNSEISAPKKEIYHRRRRLDRLDRLGLEQLERHLERQRHHHRLVGLDLEQRLQQHRDRVIERLEKLYKDPNRFSDELSLQKRDFLPQLTRRNKSRESSHTMENSRHDIFTPPMTSNQLRRIVVSGNNTAETTGLCRSLAYDWATQNPSSRLSEQQVLFEISASRLKPSQTIEGAIKEQLFTDLDAVGESQIRDVIHSMPDAVTILIDGFDGKHVRKYGDNITKVLRGQALQEVTVMVTARPRSANQLERLANISGVAYDHIDMH